MCSAATPVSKKCLRIDMYSSEGRLGGLNWEMTAWAIDHTDGATNIPLLPLSQLFLSEESMKVALRVHCLSFQLVVYV